MSPIKSLLSCLIGVLLWSMAQGQNPNMPIKIEKKTLKHTETNSKYGKRVIPKTHLEAVYRDSTRSILTHTQLKTWMASVPEAHIEWQKYQRSRLYKAASLPLLAVGTVGGMQYFSSTAHKQRNALIGILGIAGGLELFIHFNKKEQKHENMLIAYYNRHGISEKLERNFRKVIEPDVFQAGFLSNNQLGVKWAWYLW